MPSMGVCGGCWQHAGLLAAGARAITTPRPTACLPRLSALPAPQRGGAAAGGDGAAAAAATGGAAADGGGAAHAHPGVCGAAGGAVLCCAGAALAVGPLYAAAPPCRCLAAPTTALLRAHLPGHLVPSRWARCGTRPRCSGGRAGARRGRRALPISGEPTCLPAGFRFPTAVGGRCCGLPGAQIGPPWRRLAPSLKCPLNPRPALPLPSPQHVGVRRQPGAGAGRGRGVQGDPPGARPQVQAVRAGGWMGSGWVARGSAGRCMLKTASWPDPAGRPGC